MSKNIYSLGALAFIFALIALMFYLQPIPISTSDWWNNDWQFRIKFTFNYTKITENQTNFPTLVYLNSSRVNWKAIQDDLSDLRFIANNQTLAHEVENYIVNSKAWIWVKTNTSISFYMYYDNPLVSSIENKTMVWNNNFVMVQHLKDLTTSTTEDSTINNNDGTKIAINKPLELDGYINKAQNFSGTDVITVNYAQNLNLDNFTISAWIKLVSLGTSQKILIKYTGLAKNRNYDFGVYSTNYLRIIVGDGINAYTLTGITPLIINNWYYVIASYDSYTLNLFLNNGLENSINLGIVLNKNTNDVYIGSSVAVSSPLFGIMDECRIYNQAKTIGWINTSYYSESDNLLIYGSEENYG